MCSLKYASFLSKRVKNKVAERFNLSNQKVIVYLKFEED